MFSANAIERLRAECLKGVHVLSLPAIINEVHRIPRHDTPSDEAGPDGPNRLPAVFRFSEEDLITALEIIRENSLLEELDLHGMYLNQLPDMIGHLSNLRALSLQGNLLQSIPESIEGLKSLEYLDLRDNRLLSLPNALRSLPQLRHLFLSNNNELGLPPEILGPHPLPELFAIMESWSTDAYQRSILDLLRPYWRSTTDLPARKQQRPQEQLPEGRAKAILDYYFDSRRRRLNEAKVLLIGQGGVGKTSLVRRLVDGTFDEHEAKTDGIAIRQWSVSTIEDTAIRLNVWDFGGQEIMHSTHQFFLTKRSLYVIVLDARAGEDQGNLHYWLEMIRVYGDNCPVLIVVNKCDEHFDRLDEKRLRLDYESKVKLSWFHYVSCKTGQGVSEVLESIRLLLSRLPHVSDWLPERYFTVKHELESRAFNIDFITEEEYATVCLKHGVTERADQIRLLRFLHDLGCVLHYDDPDQRYQFQDTRVLNPAWVTGGVYKVLNDPTLLRVGDGVVKHSDLPQLLNADDEGRRRYPEHRHRFLIDLMRRYELCVDFPDNDTRVLVPELLSKNEPDVGWVKPSQGNKDVLDFQYHYTVLPRGLIPRFIVRTQHLLTDQPTVWRAGVVLLVEGCRVLVRGDVRTAKVFIQVQGQGGGNRRAALAIVRNYFDTIYLTYGDLGAEAKVPLPRDPQAPAVDYQLLLKLEREGVAEQWFEKAKAPYIISDLLNGVDMRSADVFLSYNSKDRELVSELAKRLQEHSVRCWLDQHCLTPGERWQMEIAAAVRDCRTIAVLIGSHALGPWQQEEAFVGLDYAARGLKRVIPVLLPKAGKMTGLPSHLDFLSNRTWIKFGKGYDEELMRKLARAILDA